MLQKEKVTLIGAPPSPYTRKMIALLRYRHIPYEIIWGNPGELLAGEGPYADLNIEPPKPVLLPTFLMSCLLYTSPSPRDRQKSRMPSSA